MTTLPGLSLSSLRFIALVTTVLMASIPLSASAATARPSCYLQVSTSQGDVKIREKGEVLLLHGDELRITWVSKNATEATNANGDPLSLSGAETFSPSASTAYSYRFTSGSKKTTCTVTARVVTGSINASSLTSSSLKPTLSGTLTGIKTAYITIQKTDSTKKIYTSKLKVVSGKWTARVSKKLSNGTYDVIVSSTKSATRGVIVRGVLTVDTEKKNSPKTATTFAVSSVPLLFGGTARAATAVPVSYLQITNTGKEPASLKGFWIKQNGSAPTESVIGLSTVDDQGGSRSSVGGTEGSLLFKNGSAFVPTDALFEPGQMRLFTIKAILTGNTSNFLGTQLVIDVTALDANASIQEGSFPIRGTTWTIGG